MGNYEKRLEQKLATERAMKKDVQDTAKANAAVSRVAPERKQNALERLENLESRISDIENSIPQILMAVNRVLGKQKADLEEVRAIVDAAVEILGLGQVQEVLNERAAKANAKKAADQKLQLEAMLKDGELTSIEEVAIEPAVVIEGFERDKDGNPVDAGYMVVFANGVAPDVQEQIKGQKVGFTAKTSTEGTFEILGVYRVCEKPEKEVDEAAAQQGLAELEQKVAEAVQPVATETTTGAV